MHVSYRTHVVHGSKKKRSLLTMRRCSYWRGSFPANSLEIHIKSFVEKVKDKYSIEMKREKECMKEDDGIQT